MKKFNVYVEKHFYDVVQVEADNEQMARDLVQKDIDSCGLSVEWDSGDELVSDVEEVKE